MFIDFKIWWRLHRLQTSLGLSSSVKDFHLNFPLFLLLIISNLCGFLTNEMSFLSALLRCVKYDILQSIVSIFCVLNSHSWQNLCKSHRSPLLCSLILFAIFLLEQCGTWAMAQLALSMYFVPGFVKPTFLKLFEFFWVYF